MVTGLVPPKSIDTGDGQPSLGEVYIIHPGTGVVEESLDIATSLLENHPVEVDESIQELPGVGDRTAEYLRLAKNVSTVRDVKREFKHGELKHIVQERFHDELEERLEDETNIDIGD